MSLDRNLLFGVLALEVDLIDRDQWAEAYRLWRSGLDRPMSEVLQRRGWISAVDRDEVDRLLERRLTKSGGDPSKLLPTMDDAAAWRSVAGLSVEEGRSRIESTEPSRQEAASGLARRETELPGTFPPPSAGPREVERYTLDRLHARGGVGRVWVARDGGLGRPVAVKELRPEKAHSAAARARLVREARVTGQLQHPGIVPVYELMPGSEDRSPSYVMRLVEGRTLTEAVREFHKKRKDGSSSPLDQLALLNAFVDLCQTIAYAHSRGVIHRDLKGPNVVIGEYGEVVVLDWGLARVLGDEGSEPGMEPVTLDPEEAPIVSVDGKALGTPAYMPPEQALGNMDEIGPHSDVYGLGAVLYEILTGAAPFDGANSKEMLELARRGRPLPPREVCATVPRALDAICMKALAYAPANRYGSAAELARDVQRYLADEPIQAAPEPWPTRLARVARKHKAALAVAAALVVMTAVGLGGYSAMVVREKKNVQAVLAMTLDALQLLLLRAGEEKLARLPEASGVQEGLLDDTLSICGTLLANGRSDPAVRRVVGHAYQRVGDLFRMIGRPERAQRAHEEAARIFGDLVSEGGAGADHRLDLAISRGHLGETLRLNGDRRGAEALEREAEAEFGRLAAFGVETLTSLRERAINLDGLALLHFEAGRYPAAVNHSRRAVALLETLAEPVRSEPKSRFELARVRNQLGNALEPSRPAEAEVCFRSAIITLDGRLAEAPDDPATTQLLGVVHHNLGKQLAFGPRPRAAEAEHHLRRALAIAEGLCTRFPRIPRHHVELANAANTLGALLVQDGRLDEAQEALRQAEGLFGELAGADHTNADAVGRWGMALGNCGEVAYELGHLDVARRLLRRAITEQLAALRTGRGHADWLGVLAGHYRRLAKVLGAEGRHAEASADWTFGGILTLGDVRLDGPARLERTMTCAAEARAQLRLALGRAGRVVWQIAASIVPEERPPVVSIRSAGSASVRCNDP